MTARPPLSTRFLQSLLVSVLMGTLSAASADPAGRSFTPGPFDQLHFTGAANVRYQQGERDELFVEGEGSALEGLDVQLRDGRLTVSQQGNWRFWRTQRLQMRVTTRELRGLSISGAADFVAAESVQVKELDIHISGAGLVRFDQLKAERLKFSVSGSGDGQFSGSAQELAVQVSGRGDFIAPRLQTQVARVSVSGLGRVKVWALDELNASLSGVGSIDFWGNPPKGQRRLAGLGSLQSRGETPPER